MFRFLLGVLVGGLGATLALLFWPAEEEPWLDAEICPDYYRGWVATTVEELLHDV